MFKNVAAQKLIVFAFDSTTNLPKTGDAANITAYVGKDYGAATVLGDTSATEIDSTNAKGYYLFDLTQAETNGDTLHFTAKSSTANIVVIGVPAVVFTLPASFTSLNVTNANTLSSHDPGATIGTGTSTLTQTQVSGGAYALNSASFSFASALDFTTTQKTSLNAATPASVQNISAQTGDSFARLGAPAGASIAADLAEIEAETDGIAAIPTTPVTTSHFDTIIGTPVTSVSADIAAVKTDTGTILTDVNTGAGAIYNRLGAPAGASIAADIAEIEADTDTLTTGVTVTTNNDKTGYALSATGANLVLVDGKTLPAALQIIAAAAIGKVSGAGSGTEIFVGLDGVTTRATVTVDSSGNRTAVVYV